MNKAIVVIPRNFKELICRRHDRDNIVRRRVRLNVINAWDSVTSIECLNRRAMVIKGNVPKFELRGKEEEEGDM